jgi:hypothetical protein
MNAQVNENRRKMKADTSRLFKSIMKIVIQPGFNYTRNGFGDTG